MPEQTIKTLQRFGHLQRVKVVNPDDAHETLRNETGTVVRLLRRDYSAWIRMDQPIPDSLRSFPATDDRGNHVLLWPDECAND